VAGITTRGATVSRNNYTQKKKTLYADYTRTTRGTHFQIHDCTTRRTTRGAVEFDLGAHLATILLCEAAWDVSHFQRAEM
jgi:hypothetical protein